MGPLKESDLSEDWFLKISPLGHQPVMKYNKEDLVIESLKIMDFLERNLPVDIYPMAIPCSTSTRSYQKYLFFASLLDTMPMEGLALRAGADQEKIIRLEQLIISLKDVNMSDRDNNRLAERIQSLENRLELVRDDVSHSRAISGLKRTLEKLDQEMEDNPGSSWILGQSFSALDMFLAVIVHELVRLGYQELLLDKKNIAAFTQRVQLHPAYMEILGPLVSKDVSQVADTAGAGSEETPAEPGDEGERSSPLQEARKARKKASEDRSWYNLW